MPGTSTNPRIDYKAFQDIVPEMGTGMAAISHALRKSGIEPDLLEMLKVRVSQLNGCAFCVQYHLNDARKLNVSAAKLDLLAAWREAGIYSAREAAALEWAECLTLLANHHIDDETTPASPRILLKRNCIPDHGHRPNQFLEPDCGSAPFHAANPSCFLALRFRPLLKADS